MVRNDWRDRLNRGMNTQRNKPSNFRPKFKRSVPPGATDVWRVTHFDGAAWRVHEVYLNEEEAYAEADFMHFRVQGKVRVEHKAAIELGGKVYIVNLDPLYIRLPKDTSAQEQERPSVRACAKLPALCKPSVQEDAATEP